MTNPGDSDEWWKQYGGQGVSPESGIPSASPQQPYPPSVPQYPQQPVTPPPQQQQAYPSYPQSQPNPYGQPNYAYQAPPPYQPYGYPQQQGTNGMAIGALISSLVGFATCGIGSIVGIILGVVSLNQIKQSGQDGRGMALAGIWIGIGAVVLAVLWFLVVIISAASGSH
ncbi:DUF4190 domain-containing protein [Nocardia arthritidis]|uniref:DUF4190 domain-containing protein n=1 Tax=Nocardia arthritidis TaxID=228602 RepID=A0A6G9Y4Q3_9NOCA|nr:DUF4190 domain-containing protein [Nocardia arthritidis]QIS08179.1 DUF4190 domain-containing protein [Nocardia arthritidis]